MHLLRNMDESMVENCAAEDASACCGPPPPPPPPSQRRPRVREVSSRFMSPVVSSSADHPLPTKSQSPLPKHQHHAISTPTPTPTPTTTPEIPPKQRSSSVNRRRRHLEYLEPLRCSSSDENRPTAQSSETPLPPDVRKQRPLKPFKENGGGGPKPQHQHQQQPHLPKPSRPDTPMAMVSASLDRTSSSRFRLIQQQQQRASNMTSTAAAKLLQSNLAPEANTRDAISSTPNPHHHHPYDDNYNHSRQIPSDIRSSMPEADMLPTVSSRHHLVTEKSADFSRFPGASPCSRSLNLPLSGSEQSSFLQSIKGREQLTSAVSKPPVPPPCATAKLGKGKKVSSHREDAQHSLRLLHNRYLQWRYANATAEASMRAQQIETQRMLYSLAVKIAELYDSVKRKRIELGTLQRTKTLSTILEAQIPYLDQWFALQGDYSISLAEATQALLNASLQLPISGNVRADKREVEEALYSAIQVMEIIVSHVQRSIPKAEETETFISELARVIGRERALIEECENLLSKTYTVQVEECSLRGHIIQLKQRCCPSKIITVMKSEQ